MQIYAAEPDELGVKKVLFTFYFQYTLKSLRDSCNWVPDLQKSKFLFENSVFRFSSSTSLSGRSESLHCFTNDGSGKGQNVQDLNDL